MLEWVGHSTQKNHVCASAKGNFRLVLNTFAWVDGIYWYDLRKVESKDQKKVTAILSKNPLSFLLFIYILVLPHLPIFYFTVLFDVTEISVWPN